MVHQGDEEPPQRCTLACCPSVSLPLPPASLLPIPLPRVLHALGKNALQRIPQEIRESFPSVVIPYRNCQVISLRSEEICRGNYSSLSFPLIRSMTWGTFFLDRSVKPELLQALLNHSNLSTPTRHDLEKTPVFPIQL